jgi:hypothetical protein
MLGTGKLVLSRRELSKSAICHTKTKQTKKMLLLLLLMEPKLQNFSLWELGISKELCAEDKGFQSYRLPLDLQGSTVERKAFLIRHGDATCPVCFH